jgi:hypothetical protein
MQSSVLPRTQLMAYAAWVSSQLSGGSGGAGGAAKAGTVSALARASADRNLVGRFIEFPSIGNCLVAGIPSSTGYELFRGMIPMVVI